MYLIVGLGNPEEDYKMTRHNMGFEVINEISKEYKIDVNKDKFNALYGTGIIENEKVILLKPQTYMNLSGLAIRECINFHKIDIDNIIVIYDDMDIEKGMIRIRKKGRHAGHNGIKSVIEQLQTEEFDRVRVGIGKSEEKYDKIDYVVGKITNEEFELLKIGIDKAKDAVVEILKNGIDKAMNVLN